MRCIEELDTPAVTIDLDVMDDNIRRLQGYCDEHGYANRPHIKTHKIPAIAHKQLGAGAVGITCQKLGEAEVFAAAGIHDILITFNIVGASKLERLCRLAHQVTMTVVADSEQTVRGLAEATRAEGVHVGVEIECDTGGHRAGVQTLDEAMALARIVADSPGLEFRGLMTYPTSAEMALFVREARERFAKAGLNIPVVSGGGTPGYRRTHEIGEVTEVRAGTYVYNDRTTVGQGAATLDQCAQRVLMTVVSRPTADRGILDGGSKTMSSDPLNPTFGSGFGHIVEYPEAVVYQQSEEHGHVDFSRCSTRPKVGDRVTVVANHCCVVTNLHDEVVGHRNGQLEVIWPVAARGKVR